MLRTYRTGLPAGSEVKMLRTYHRTGLPVRSVVKMLRTYHRKGLTCKISVVKMLKSSEHTRSRTG